MAILGDLLYSILKSEVNLEGKQVIQFGILRDCANALIKQKWFIIARYDFNYFVIFHSQLAFNFFVWWDELMVKTDDKIINSDLIWVTRLVR